MAPNHNAAFGLVGPSCPTLHTIPPISEGEELRLVDDWSGMHPTTADRVDRPLDEYEGDVLEPTIPEWSLITEISEDTIRSWARRGYLRFLTVDEHQRVTVDEFLACAERLTGYASKMRRDPFMLARFLERNSVRLRPANVLTIIMAATRYPAPHLDDEHLVTTTEAAVVLKIQPDTLRRRINRYGVSAVGRRGRERLYRLTHLLATPNPERRV